MRLSLAIARGLGIVVLATAATVQAQSVSVPERPAPIGPRLDAPTAYRTAPFRTAPSSPVYTSPSVPVQSVYWPPYSYWAAWPLPARDYVGYGSNDFPFYGRRYGSSSDPWSWSGLSGYPAQYRYYYPPVR
jgi:hypothetical protein